MAAVMMKMLVVRVGVGNISTWVTLGFMENSVTLGKFI